MEFGKHDGMDQRKPIYSDISSSHNHQRIESADTQFTMNNHERIKSYDSQTSSRGLLTPGSWDTVDRR